MSTTKDQHPVQQLTTDRPDPSLGERVRTWAPHRRPQSSDALRGVAELSRLPRTVRIWEAEVLAFHITGGCSNGPTEAVNLLIKSAWNGRLKSASLVGHPRHPAGGATTGRSRPPGEEC